MNTPTERAPHGRHHLANPKGGMLLQDEDNVVPRAFKDFMSKVAKKILKADLSDILKTPAPAYVHHPRTYLEGACYDLSFAAKFLTQAALEENPMERLRLIMTFYLAGQHINPAEI